MALFNQLPLCIEYFYKCAASVAVDDVPVRISGLLEKLRHNSVVVSVRTFVQQPGRSTLGILSTLFFASIFMFFNCLPGGIRGFDAPSALVLRSLYKIIAHRAVDAKEREKKQALFGE